MNRAQTLKRDNLLVDFIFQHKGKDNVVSAKQIDEYLCEQGFPKVANLHNLIRKVALKRHLPICSMNIKGYFWGTTKEEIQMNIDDLQGRIEEMTKRIEHLKSFIIN